MQRSAPLHSKCRNMAKRISRGTTGQGGRQDLADCVVQDQWPRHVILRSSIIYGPQCSSPVSRTLFLQFVESSLRSGKPTSFFEDEYRNPIYVNVRSSPDTHHQPGYATRGPSLKPPGVNR